MINKINMYEFDPLLKKQFRSNQVLKCRVLDQFLQEFQFKTSRDYIKKLYNYRRNKFCHQILMKTGCKFLFLVLCLIINLQSIQINDSTTQIANNIEDYFPYTVKTLERYEGSRRCGFRDKNLYMNNGTYQEIGFYSSEKFSLFVVAESTNISITGFAIATEITSQSLRDMIQKKEKVYNIERYKINLVDEQITSSINIKQNQQQDDKKSSSKMYYANLKVYGVCRTAMVSTISKNLQLQVTYLSKINSPQQPFIANFNKSQNLQDPNSFTPSLNTQKVKVQTVVYCIDGVSINQANFFVCKIYYVFIVSVIALLLNFKPFKRLPLLVRLSGLIAFVWISIKADTLYDALFATYGAVFLLVIFYRIFQQRASIQPLTARRETIISKTYILVSFASALPLAIKSHLQDQSIEQKKIILYPINFIMMCNSLLFICSMVKLTRFRHAFYYFLALVLAEHYFYPQVSDILGFGILEFQIFPVPYDSQSLFFAFWLIPLCDFFFKSYSSDSLYKFVIILVPILAKPFFISFSTSFALGIISWIISGRLNARDIIKIIKYKK